MVLKGLLEISNKDESHLKIKVLGFIKFSILKKDQKARLTQLEKQFKHYKKNNIDITTYPKATGDVRRLQLIQLEILKEIDYVCRTHNLDYWLDFGTLIGAVRHNGFIPWDDDVDLGMPREDYDKFIDLFNSTTRNPKLVALYPRVSQNALGCFIKVKCNNSPFSLDIFPYDFYSKKVEEDKKIDLTTKIKELREEKINNIVRTKGLSNCEILDKINELRTEILCGNSYSKESKNTLFWGVDYFHLWKNYFFDYDVIYPLQDIQFENCTFKSVNNPDKYLKQVYGDYMTYPKKVNHFHTLYTISKQQLEEFERLTFNNNREKQ